LNSYILKGDAAQGMELVFDSLMTRANDEPDAIYALLAETVEISGDGRLYIFNINPKARFHDGSPLSAEDAAFSLQLLKSKGHPLISQAMRELSRISAANKSRLEVEFSGRHSRDLPLFVAQLPIFSKAYYSTHDFTKTTLEPPLGSGPYKVGQFRAGSYINYDRVKDYWAKDLGVNTGRFNFDRVRFEFYRDRTAQFEAFKSGDYRLREEFTSKTWATGYTFPAVKDGRVRRLVLPDDTPSGAQGWFINTRRKNFTDPRVREALIYAFDFEWTNKVLFYGAYQRTRSFFENSVMMAKGRPSEPELKLLEPFRGQIPDEVFGEPFSPPVSNGRGQDRRLLRHASQLLRQAGWTVRNGLLRNADGEVFRLEILEDSPGFKRIILPYIKNLEILGIRARLRMVDPAQYQSRLKSFDFDMTTRRYSMPPTPGEEILRYWSSADANIKGSRNLSGIASPAVDALTQKVIQAKSRKEQVIAARALDRVLRAGRYWVPQWFKASHTLAFWDEFGRPKTKPRYARGIVETWWYEGMKKS
ncbi:MAG TPA: ABC transporter substrate-binding protein, partial [Rhizobiales bacterium]|nr:ABC transporter substrate-binding protein [Hyphomicrobiales bacterium]